MSMLVPNIENMKLTIVVVRLEDRRNFIIHLLVVLLGRDESRQALRDLRALLGSRLQRTSLVAIGGVHPVATARSGREGDTDPESGGRGR